MSDEEKAWEELKRSQSNYANNGGTLYFHNKEEFEQLVILMNQVLNHAQEEFFENRLLVIGTNMKPLTSKAGESYSHWEILYQPLGKNQEESFLTTDENGNLLNLVDLPLADAIGSTEKIISLIESGELKTNEYETNFVHSSHLQVGYPSERERMVRL